MRPQSPKFLQTITTTRIISSPPREPRNDSCGRLAKVTTYQQRPKATVTTTTYRPTIETRTVKLCTDKKCSGHETLIDQLTLDNNKLNQRIIELQSELEQLGDKYDNEQQGWMTATIEIESMRKLLEETQKNHQQEITYLNSELTTFKQQYQFQEEQIRFLTSQIKQQEKVDVLENRISLLNQEIERLQHVLQDKNEFITQQGFIIQDYEKQLKVCQEVIEERNTALEDFEQQSVLFKKELEQSNEIIHQLKQEITQKDFQTQQLLAQKDSLLQNFRDNLLLLESKLTESLISNEKKDSEIQILEEQVLTLKNKISLLEAELNDLGEHNYLLNQQVIVNEQEKDTLQQQIELQAKSHEFVLQSKVDDHEQTKQEQETLQQQIYDLKLQIEQKDNDLSKLLEASKAQDICFQAKIIEVTELKNCVTELTSEVANLTESYQNQQQKLKEASEQNYQTQSLLNETFENNKRIIEQLQNEVKGEQILNSELTTKQIEISVALVDTQAKLLDIFVSNQQLQEIIVQQKGKVEDLECSGNQTQEQLSNEITILQQQLKQYQELNNDLREKSQDFETQIKQLTVLSLEESTKLIEKQQESQKQIDKLTVDQNNIQEQLLLQCLEVERLQQQNKSQGIIAESQETQLQKLAEDAKQQENEIEKLRAKCDTSEKQVQEAELNQKQQQKLLQNEIEGLKNDLKYQLSLEEELNKKNHFQQNQINHLQDVEQQLRYLNEQTSIQAKSLQKELENKSESESTLKFKLEKLLEELKIKQLQLNEYDQQVRQMEQNSFTEINQYEERMTYLGNEVETWKQKFVILNRDYHRVQEDLMMLQAEFDAFKKRGQDIKNIKVSFQFQNQESTCFEVRKSSLYKENIDIKASQTSIGRLFKENI